MASPRRPGKTQSSNQPGTVRYQVRIVRRSGRVHPGDAAGTPNGHPGGWDVPPPRPALSAHPLADVGYVQPPANFPAKRAQSTSSGCKPSRWAAASHVAYRTTTRPDSPSCSPPSHLRRRRAQSAPRSRPAPTFTDKSSSVPSAGLASSASVKWLDPLHRDPDPDPRSRSTA
jgi:hypothetical protein